MKKEYLKVIVFSIFLVLFESFVYFICKLSPIDVTVITSSFDQKLPLIPFFCLFYYLWYIYLFLIPFIMYKVNPNYFYKYASITIITVLVGAIIFILFPTTIERGVNINEVKSIFKYPLKFIYFTDTPNLCCLPSMHCALAYIFMYMALSTKELKIPYKIMITLSSLGIVLSTLFIKQHVIWDVLAAILLIIISLIIDKFTKIDKFVQKKFENFKYFK